MLRTRFSSSTPESRSPSSSALIRVEIRSSAGRLAPALDQRPDPGVELADLAIDRGELLGIAQRRRVELPLDPHRPVMEASGVPGRGAHHLGDHPGRVGAGHGLDEVAAAGRGHRPPEILEDRPHRGPVAIDRPRRQRRVDELAEAAVIGPVDVDDVVDHLLAQRAVGDREQVGEQQAREDRRLRAQEELPGLAIEHDRRERRPRQPLAGALQLPHRLVPALPAQLRIRRIDLGELEVGECGHRALTACPGQLLRPGRPPRAARPRGSSRRGGSR